MGLSNYIPSSRISQAGVCTSSTRPASPYEGQMIYETDTNRVLVYDNTAWVMIADTDQPPGLVLIKNSTAVYGTNTLLDISDIFTSQFANYKVVINNLRMSASNTTLSLQLLKAGVPANTNYDFAYRGIGSDGTGRDTYATGQSSLSDLGCFNTNANSYRQQVGFEVIGPAISAMTTTFLNISSAGFATNFFTRNGSAQHVVTDSYDGFRLFPSGGGTFEAQVAVYGFRNS